MLKASYVQVLAGRSTDALDGARSGDVVKVSSMWSSMTLAGRP